MPVLQSNTSSFTDLASGLERFVGLQSVVDLIYLRDSETNELVAGDKRHCAQRQHPPSCSRARISRRMFPTCPGAALTDQDNSTRWRFDFSKSVKFVDVYAHHNEYGLWVQENLVYHSPHKLGRVKGGKPYRAGQALHDPPGRQVPWSVEGGEGAKVAYNYLGQSSWGRGDVWVRQGDEWVLPQA